MLIGHQRVRSPDDDRTGVHHVLGVHTRSGSLAIAQADVTADGADGDMVSADPQMIPQP